MKCLTHISLILWLVITLGCSAGSKRADNAAVSRSQANNSSDMMNINGTLVSWEEMQQLNNKVMAEKKRRNLSDRDALILMNEETEKLLKAKRKQR